MISIDANILVFGYDPDSPFHPKARAFLESLSERKDVLVSELILVELYRLLRNPIVFKRALTAPAAVDVIQAYRSHPNWKATGFARVDSESFHDELWKLSAKDSFAYRRIFDLRSALSLIRMGVTDFATANVKDFEGFGFKRVWNPLIS